MDELTIVIDDADPNRICLSGSASRIRNALPSATALLAASASQLIIDVGGVTKPGASLVRLLNGLARDAAEGGKDIVVEVPDDADRWLVGATLHPLLRVVRTSPLPPLAPRAPEAPPAPAPTPPPDGQARREGRGFIASYGQARRCAATGCSATLSRYNGDRTCSSHDLDAGGPLD